MKDVFTKIFVSGGMALVLAGAVFVGSYEPVDAKTVEVGATNYSTKADYVRVNMTKFEIADDVKRLEIVVKNTKGQVLDSWDAAYDKDKDVFLWGDAKGKNLSYFGVQWSKDEFVKTDKVKLEFKINGKSFTKNISLLGKNYKSVKFKDGEVAYEYGNDLKWKISSKGISN